DAERLRYWIDEFRPIVERVLRPEAQSAPISPRLRGQLLARSPLGRKLLDVAARSPLEFVEQEFEHDVIRAVLLFFNGLREIDLRLKGFGHSIPALLAGKHMAQMCLGGSARLAQALADDIREHGAEISTHPAPKPILIRRGESAGIELTNRERAIVHTFDTSGLD